MQMALIGLENWAAVAVAAHNRKGCIHNRQAQCNRRYNQRYGSSSLDCAVNRNSCQHIADEHTACIAHKNSSRIKIVADKADNAAGQSRSHYRYMIIAHLNRNQNDRQRCDSGYACSQAVQTVNQIDNVRKADNPENCQRYRNKPFVKAANVDEALALLEKYDMNSSMETANFHFLLSDADGKNVVLEYTIDDMTVIDTNYVANHYLAPKMHGLGHAYDRFAVLDSAVKFKKSIFTPFEAMSLLSLVSQPETEEATSMTQWSVVYNLHDLTAQVAIRRNYDKLFNFTLADLSGKAKI